MILCVFRLLIRHALYVTIIWQPYLKWAPRLPWGLSKIRVRRRNPSVGQSHLEQP
jgi:hypothetical protein